ncbi:MAG TPA: hypothetical protein VMZ30_14880 [Pyrinomonadaceae bacterium]|nr:hypothetical protein [Pyrinomonadaceae bacterium]
MRSNGWILVLLLAIASLGMAQDDSSRNLVVSLPNGGFVGFKSHAASIEMPNSSAAVRELWTDFKAQAFADENHIIHRLLSDETGKYVFGYDLVIEPVRASKTFNIAVKPLDSEIENKLLASSGDSSPARIATLPQFAEPQILDDGDSFTLDLLVNNKTGVKIVDVVRVSFDRSNLWKENPRTLPRDFTLDAVALRVVNFRLLVDGNMVGKGKPGTDFAGALLWCYVEDAGRFIFSLVPREGYEFQKAGVITDNKIEFTLDGRHYEWLSSAPILPTEGIWNLWVLHDPKYLPFGSQEIRRQGKSRLDKLDDSIKAAQAKAAGIRQPKPTTFGRNPETQESVDGANQRSNKRFKVMVGAADRMENLWPK